MTTPRLGISVIPEGAVDTSRTFGEILWMGDLAEKREHSNLCDKQMVAVARDIIDETNETEKLGKRIRRSGQKRKSRMK